MTVQRVLGAALLVAGVFVLTGLGWALLAAGALVMVTSGGTKLADAWTTTRGKARGAASSVAAVVKKLPRQAAAVIGVGAAVVAIPVGLGLVAGVGYAMIAAGASLGGVGLLLGWNAGP